VGLFFSSWSASFCLAAMLFRVVCLASLLCATALPQQSLGAIGNKLADLEEVLDSLSAQMGDEERWRPPPRRPSKKKKEKVPAWKKQLKMMSCNKKASACTKSCSKQCSPSSCIGVCSEKFPEEPAADKKELECPEGTFLRKSFGGSYCSKKPRPWDLDKKKNDKKKTFMDFALETSAEKRACVALCEEKVEKAPMCESECYEECLPDDCDGLVISKITSRAVAGKK